MQKTFEEIVHYRRSVRQYQNTPIDTERVKHCLELATLAPNSSNMQLWEFYHITNPDTLKRLSEACFNQGAAKTAQQMVVFLTRQDLARKRAKTIHTLSKENIERTSPPASLEKRLKRIDSYYGKLMPFLYARFFGILGFVRIIMANVIGLFNTIVYQVSENDVRVVVHKTCGLAAQTFMLAMASEHLDTCPMEGFDSRKVRRILNLPYGAEINMIVSCGIRDEKGVWGDRVRVPFEEVYKRV
jgi:nitroreductase